MAKKKILSFSESAADHAAWYRVRNAGQGEAEISIFGEIGVP